MNLDGNVWIISQHVAIPKPVSLSRTKSLQNLHNIKKFGGPIDVCFLWALVVFGGMEFATLHQNITSTFLFITSTFQRDIEWGWGHLGWLVFYWLVCFAHTWETIVFSTWWYRYRCRFRYFRTTTWFPFLVRIRQCFCIHEDKHFFWMFILRWMMERWEARKGD